ncbi:MAG: D-tyrosyl-tRNA(Tyr) deacylase [Candidatus Eremiobacteraeota bacterium]|nr:D-tyrosyl-tRNA(Tyr) deacylase [Candidatus Eremiobacteraeota bacterium]MBV8497753.1 D-tyrosyl-tRNA(Tyr) deacylase [Candidatus Eremiobacteraeota bacterium]
MRAVVQRVSRACVRVEGATIGEIGAGLMVLLGVGVDDGPGDARAMAEKLAGLRIFPDAQGLMNRSIQEHGGAVLLVSQFTLHGDARRGRRPSFIAAAKEPEARALYQLAGHTLESMGVRVAYGEFGANMDVELVNQGPVTLLLDTKRAF